MERLFRILKITVHDNDECYDGGVEDATRILEQATEMQSQGIIHQVSMTKVRSNLGCAKAASLKPLKRLACALEGFCFSLTSARAPTVAPERTIDAL